MDTFRDAIEAANAKGAGKFHVFEGACYHSSWHSYRIALSVSDRQVNGRVFTASGNAVTPA